jgi:hypothetical protein
MDVLLIEIVLWAGLIFFFWSLKDSLGHLESDLESVGLLESSTSLKRLRYVQPDRVGEPIGRYNDAPIYRYALIEGENYQFDYILPSCAGTILTQDQRCLSPGLVYTRCVEQPLTETQHL